MLKSRLFLATVVTVVVGIVATQAALAQSAVDLLDRGSSHNAVRGPAPTNALTNPGGSPGVTLGMIMTGAPAAAPGVFAGYVFVSTPAPTMATMGAPQSAIPTSWLPFQVTGAYAFALGAPFVGGAAPILGAGVGPLMTPFTIAAWNPGGFIGLPGTAPGAFSPGMVFGMAGLFSTGSAPFVSAASDAVACGFDVVVPGAVLGGLTPGTGGGRPIVNFVPPGTMSGAAPVAAPPATYVAGCFVSGATVPVELQTYSID